MSNANTTLKSATGSFFGAISTTLNSVPNMVQRTSDIASAAADVIEDSLRAGSSYALRFRIEAEQELLNSIDNRLKEGETRAQYIDKLNLSVKALRTK